jgi:hypothetical protein
MPKRPPVLRCEERPAPSAPVTVTSSASPSASAVRQRFSREPQRREFVSSCWSCSVGRMPKAGLFALRRISQLRHSGLAEDVQSRHRERQGFRLLSPRHYNKRSRLQISIPAESENRFLCQRMAARQYWRLRRHLQEWPCLRIPGP